MIRGLVLDVDDTVYLERDYVRSGFRAVETWCVRHLGVDGVGTHAWGLFEQGARRTTLTDALTARGVTVTAELTRAVVEHYRSHRPDISLLPDADGLLRSVEGRLPISVVTDGPAASQRAKVDALGLARWASRIVVTAEHGSSKPDPAMFRIATADWDVPAGQIAYVADNPEKDFGGPLELGWQAVRVRRPQSLHEGEASPAGVVEIERLTASGLIDRLP